jgi:hypothetical protein
MNRIAAVATLLIFIHQAIAAVHGAAHQQLGVGLESWQHVFVWVIITILPLVSLVLYWTRFRQTAAGLLLVSMLGSLLFGVCYHFIIISPDHVSHLPEGTGRGLFVVTAILLAFVEGLAAAFGLWSWLRFRRGTEKGS